MEHMENSVKSEVDLESDSEPKLEIAEDHHQHHHGHHHHNGLFTFFVYNFCLHFLFTFTEFVYIFCLLFSGHHAHHAHHHVVVNGGLNNHMNNTDAVESLLMLGRQPVVSTER